MMMLVSVVLFSGAEQASGKDLQITPKISSKEIILPIVSPVLPGVETNNSQNNSGNASFTQEIIAEPELLNHSANITNSSAGNSVNYSNSSIPVYPKNNSFNYSSNATVQNSSVIPAVNTTANNSANISLNISEDNNASSTNLTKAMMEIVTVSTKNFIHGNGLLASKSSDDSQLSYFIQDHLGSNIKVVNNMLEAQENKYYAFGETVSSGEDGNDYKYTGKEMDEETEMYYYGARYYQPELGRFMQADSVRGSIENPLTLNRYAYTLNNPLKYVDPSGNIVVLSESVLNRMNEDPAFKKAMENLMQTDYYKQMSQNENYVWRIEAVSQKSPEAKEANRKVWLGNTDQENVVLGWSEEMSVDEVNEERSNLGTNQLAAGTTSYIVYDKWLKDKGIPGKKEDKQNYKEAILSMSMFQESSNAYLWMVDDKVTMKRKEKEGYGYAYKTLLNMRDGTGDFDGMDKSYMGKYIDKVIVFAKEQYDKALQESIIK